MKEVLRLRMALRDPEDTTKTVLVDKEEFQIGFDEYGDDEYRTATQYYTRHTYVNKENEVTESDKVTVNLSNVLYWTTEEVKVVSK